MNDSIPMMYHGGGYGAPGPLYAMPTPINRPRHFMETQAGRIGSPALPGTPRRPPHKRHQHKINTYPPNNGNKGDSIAFGYDSDDSSLSSNASGSNKSIEKSENSTNRQHAEPVNNGYGGYGGYAGGYNGGYREWRGRRREPHRNRRIAPDRFFNVSYPFQVKYTPDDLLNGSEYDTLSQEIWDKFLKTQQTEETFRKKMNLWRYLYITIKSIYPRHGLYVVGSTMSGFALDSSDMDLCLYVRGAGAAAADSCAAPGEARALALAHLDGVMTCVRAIDPAAELLPAKVPIVRFREARTGLHVDLNCNNVVGVRNTELLRACARLDWRVRPLVAAAKLWARAHDVNDARRCTLSSYALTLMVLHFLQCGASPPVLPRMWPTSEWEGRPRSHNRDTLGELFLSFLRYYAEFPYDKMAVSVRVGAGVPLAECRAARAHKNDPHQWKLLCVEEPFDLTNTARAVYDEPAFRRIVAAFRASHRRLARGLRLRDAWPEGAAPSPAAPAPAPSPPAPAAPAPAARR